MTAPAPDPAPTAAPAANSAASGGNSGSDSGGDAAKASPAESNAGAASAKTVGQVPRPREIGGPKWPEPTRYGDWERNGRVSDF